MMIEPWMERESGVIQVRVPLPFPLRWMNGYLIRDNNGWVLIDPGLHTLEAERHWQQTFAHFSIEPKMVHSIVLTHHHPDHYGLAGWMQELYEAPVYMAERGHRQTQLLWGEQYQQTSQQLLDFYMTHGFPQERATAMLDHLHEFVDYVTPQPQVQYLNPGDSIQLGNQMYKILETSGHAYGHLCFYQQDDERMFCGDHVMPHISPNVSYFPSIDEDPLHSFLSSLEELKTLPVKVAYPGHRDPFSNWTERINQLLHHHQQRLQWFLIFLTEPRTAWQCCQSLFGDRLSIHQLRFALSETLAHLIFLEKQGKIKREGFQIQTFQGVSR